MKKGQTHKLLAVLKETAEDLFIGDEIDLEEYAAIKCAIDLISDFVPHRHVEAHWQEMQLRYGDADHGEQLRLILRGIQATKSRSFDNG